VSLDLALSALSDNNATVQTFKVESAGDINRVLESVEHKVEKNFIVAASQDTSIDVLTQVTRLLYA
jgi:hypothetical protein